MGSEQRKRKSRARKRSTPVNKYGCKKRRVEENQERVDNHSTLSNVQPSSTAANTPCRQDVPSNSDACLNVSLSAKKLNTNFSSTDHENIQNDECHILINTEKLFEIFSLIGHCPECFGKLNVDHLTKKKQGLVQFFKFTCCECNWDFLMSTSKHAKNPKKATKKIFYEVNVRAVMAFRENGLSRQGLSTFCYMMNMPEPMTQSSYNNINSHLHLAYCESSQASMKKAANEIRGNRNDIVDATVSGDAAWQRRGYSSLNGVTALVSEGKVIDTEVLTKRCKACERWRNKKNSNEYKEWKATHVCPINHKGSAGAMEATGVLKMFNRSERINNLRYTTYIGDGDTKTHQDIVQADPYHGVVVSKAECIGHVQKRVGSRLRTLKDDYKKQKLRDGKSLTGKGRLTKKVMNTLQNYYGMAIRQNVGNLYGMKKAVAAIIFHRSESSNPDQRHAFCPRTIDSWCKFQRDKLTGLNTHKDKLNIPPAVSEVLKPIFSHKDLGNDELLKKCLHGKTQNPNESLHNMIWKRCPKRVHVNRLTMEIAVASSVVSFNDGQQGLMNVFEKLFIPIGKFCLRGMQKSDKPRIKHMNLKSSEKGKLQRKRLRDRRKGYEDKEKEKEGESYSSGAFT